MDPQQSRRRSNRRTFIAFLVGIPISAGLSVLILLWGFPYSSWARWPAVRDALTKGGTLKPYDELIPPAVPDSDNFAMIQELAPLRANLEQDWKERSPQAPTQIYFPEISSLAVAGRASLTDLANLKVTSIDSLRAALIKTGCASGEGDASIAVLIALNEHRDLLEAIESGVRRKTSRFPYRYDLGFDMVPMSWTTIRQVAELFAMRCRAFRGAGLNQEAAQDVVTLLHLGRALQRDPLLISTMIGVAVERLALAEIWNGVSAHLWDDGCLRLFREELDDFDESKAWLASNMLEGAAIIKIMESSIREERPIWGAADFHPDADWLGNWILVARRKNSLIPFAECLAALPEAVSTVGGAFDRNAFDEWKKSCEAYAKWKDPLLDHIVPGQKRSLIRVLNTIMFRRFALLACKLEQTFLKTGTYPLALDSDDELGEANIDIMTGENVVYQRSDDGTSYRLYSLGWDRVDDGGDLKPFEPPWKGDWVWSLPNFSAKE